MVTAEDVSAGLRHGEAPSGPAVDDGARHGTCGRSVEAAPAQAAGAFDVLVFEAPELVEGVAGDAWVEDDEDEDVDSAAAGFAALEDSDDDESDEPDDSAEAAVDDAPERLSVR